jgi:hypothetical protein
LTVFWVKKDDYFRLFPDLKKYVFRWVFPQKDGFRRFFCSTILQCFKVNISCFFGKKLKCSVHIYCIHGPVVLNRLKFEQNHGHIENIYCKKSGAPLQSMQCASLKRVYFCLNSGLFDLLRLF